MDLYHVVLFVHILAAIVVVGGSFALDFAGARAKRARTVDSLRSWLQASAIGSKAIAASAAVTLLAGIYLAFDGGFWGDGWLTVALVLFVAAGALAGAVMDKGIGRMLEIAEGFPEGPMSPELGRQLVQPAMALAAPAMIGIDLAILFLMTNKPGYAGSLIVAGVAVTVGLAVGVRERQHAVSLAATGPAAGQPTAGPAT